MHPILALVIFYVLLALATVVLRGDLTSWSRGADQVLSLVVVLAAVALLIGAWRPVFAQGKRLPGSPSRPVWPGWLGLAALLAVVYLAVLGPASVWIARPMAQVVVQEAPPPVPEQPLETTNAPSAATTPEGGEGAEPVVPSASLEDQPLPTPVEEPEVREPAVAAAAPVERPSASMPWWQKLWNWLRERADWWRWAVIVLVVGLCGWLLYRLWRSDRERAEGAKELRPWFDDPEAPAYVREFLKLCHTHACDPVPGDTLAQLLARLQRMVPVAAELQPLTVYHYRVRYEGAAPEPEAERSFLHTLRSLRQKAPPRPVVIEEPDDAAEEPREVRRRRRRSSSRREVALTEDRDY